MNRALQALKESNPELYEQFVTSLTEDLGLGTQISSGSLECPSCHAKFEMSLTAVGNEVKRTRVKGKREWKPKPNSMFSLLVDLARLQKMTTGKVSAQFNKAMGSRLKGLSAAEVREQKMKWVKAQIAKGRSRRKAA
jgi:hypothetical protein